MGFSKFTGEILAALVVEGAGRKVPLILGNILLAAAMAGLGYSLTHTYCGHGAGNSSGDPGLVGPVGGEADWNWGPAGLLGARNATTTTTTTADPHPVPQCMEGIQITLLCAIMFFFSIGPGPFTLVVVNEMTPLLMRGASHLFFFFFCAQRVRTSTPAR